MVIFTPGRLTSHTESWRVMGQDKKYLNGLISCGTSMDHVSHCFHELLDIVQGYFKALPYQSIQK
jgi:hypothetical protein